VLCMETIGKIRRRRLIDRDSISQIARDLGLSRNTVKKALRSSAEAPEYQRIRQPRPQLGPYLPLLDQWLEAEEKLPARNNAPRSACMRRCRSRATWARWTACAGM
jgi:transposase